MIERQPVAVSPPAVLTRPGERILRVYHATSVGNAERILAEGFRDGCSFYLMLTPEPLQGVWFADEPVDGNEGARSAEGWFKLEIAATLDEIASWAVVEEGRRFIEFLIPAAVVNARLRHGRATLTWCPDRPPRANPSRFLRRWLRAEAERVWRQVSDS